MLFWRDLVGEIRRAREPRVVVSSEFFSLASPKVIERIVRDLDRERLHVMVTLRPLGRILPSQWQQNVQGGMTKTYETGSDRCSATSRAGHATRSGSSIVTTSSSSAGPPCSAPSE